MFYGDLVDKLKIVVRVNFYAQFKKKKKKKILTDWI